MWQADTTFLLFQKKCFPFSFATDTSANCYADQVSCTCSCLLSDTRLSWAASRDSGAAIADTWIKNVANSLQADMCWLVGRVAGLLWFNKRELNLKTCADGGEWTKDCMHKHTHTKECVPGWVGLGQWILPPSGFWERKTKRQFSF